ncbi:MAG TPA: 1-acyl-sn-glycerol-3-phosphate acyltransferase [Ruminococcaceae bacterium]|nr:lysophospholipid acyltransferase family protein [Oscillospiraceae bacterium]HCB65705.1 1-acyl-sn-glycerol-3-phosphate acyltransferase [Oscillospiraceae bacterium]
MINWFYYFGKAVTGLIFRFWFHIEFYGQENQPQDRGYILCCNHRSALDPVLIAQKIKKPIRYMAKMELFQNKFVSFIIRHLGAFPVARGKGDTSAIETAVETVKSGRVLGLFPEGTRSHDDQLLRFKSGAAVIASQSGGDLLPAAIWYGGKGFRSKVVIRYGKPIANSRILIEENSAKQVKAAVALLRDEVEKLLEETRLCESK